MTPKSKRIARPSNSLPLAKAEGNTMLIAIVAILVFLAGLAWGVGAGANRMSGRWSQALANELMIEIAVAADVDAQGASPELRAQRVKEILSQYAAVLSIETLERPALQEMLRPWLGDMSSYSELPLPVILKISLRQGHNLNFEDLARKIMREVPGVNVAAHYAWAGEVQTLANMISLISIGVMVLVASISVFQMVLMARARLAMFAQEIEILHTLGASDGFIAREFERQAFALSLVGALLGAIALLGVFGFVVHTLYPGIQLMQGTSWDNLPKLKEWHDELWGLLIIPAAILFLNTVMCRIAVLAALRRLV